MFFSLFSFFLNLYQATIDAQLQKMFRRQLYVVREVKYIEGTNTFDQHQRNSQFGCRRVLVRSWDCLCPDSRECRVAGFRMASLRCTVLLLLLALVACGAQRIYSGKMLGRLRKPPTVPVDDNFMNLLLT